MSPQPIILSFNLARCEPAELEVLRGIFLARVARCQVLAVAVPAEYAQGLEDEAAGHAADARRCQLEIERRARRRSASSIGAPDTTS